MVTVPDLLELLKSGVHFGHKTSKRHPTMERFIFGVRSGVHVINLEETAKQLVKALAFLKEQAQQGKTILFVGTKKQAHALIKQYATACGMPYAAERWLGGTITNFGVINSLVQKMQTLRAQRDAGELAKKYTKKEQLDFQREIERLEEMVGGLEKLTAPPDVLYVLDIRTEETAVREARRKKIPIVALCDTNVSTAGIDYVIPANDDAVKSLDIITRLVSEAINEGKAEKPAPAVVEVKQ